MKLKRLVLLTVAVCLILCASCGPMESREPVLSEMDDGELAEFLEEYGVAIPEELQSMPDMDTYGLVRGMLEDIEENPDAPPPVVSFARLDGLFENLRAAAKLYYGAS